MIQMFYMRDRQPPPNLGQWSVARHLFHMVDYEQKFVLPLMRQWLGGDTPNYADYRALAVFLWAASCADVPPMTDDEPLREHIEE